MATLSSLPGVVLAQAGGGNEFVEWGIASLILFAIVAWLARLIVDKGDSAWLPALIVGAFAAKLAGTTARYFMVNDYYRGGDAFDYHAQGRAFAEIWRTLTVPVSASGGEGTAFTELTTGVFYAIYTPDSMRTGFLMFAFVAFLGQLLFYSAFRRWMNIRQRKRFAIAVLFFPSLVFWPASIGKDSLMMFFIGLAALGISKLFEKFDILGVVYVALGLSLAAQVRPHIAAMLALSAVLAIVIVRGQTSATSGMRRLVTLGAAVLGLVLAWGSFTADFQVSIQETENTRDPTDFFESVQEQTAQGGSEVSGGVVQGPQDIPAATLKVLFRPLIYEGTSPPVLLSAVDGTILLLVVVWRMPWIWRNKGMLRKNPLLLFSFFYTGGFIIAFSAMLNLGILSRQRVQVLPFFLALVVTLAWPPEDEDEKPASSEPEVTAETSTKRPLGALPSR